MGIPGPNSTNTQGQGIRRGAPPSGYKVKGGNVVVTPFYDKDKPFFDLTNFARKPVKIDGVEYPTNEHYFQAQKFIGPPDKRRDFLQAVKAKGDGPMEALNTARDWTKTWNQTDWVNWDNRKLDVMRTALKAKLDQYPELKQELMNTGNSCLVEDTGSRDERNWGWGKDGKGTNFLGKLWMELRNELHKENNRNDLVVDVDALYKKAQEERIPLGDKQNMMQNWSEVERVQINSAPQVSPPNINDDDIDIFDQANHFMPAHQAQSQPSQVVVNHNAQFKDVLDKLSQMSDSQRRFYAITKVDDTNATKQNPSIGIEIACSANVSKKAYITPAPQGGVVYSIDSSLNEKDNKTMIENIVKFEVDNAKPGTPLTIPDGPHKEAVERALTKAMTDKYGADNFKIENGKCIIPNELPKQQPTAVLRVGK
ncbi:MAG: NADAR family protein [Candidatus Berkiella sp.]